MNLQSIKNISIKKYLSSIGCELATDRGHYGMYYAPYRNDIQASLKVDFTKNIWIDFSTTQGGGSILDLVMQIEQCNFRSAIQSLQNCQLEKKSFSFHCNKSISKQPIGITINKIKKLENVALLEYLQSRAVDIQTAQQYCKECYYSVANRNYFTIAFESDSKNAYELRSKFFKGCVGAKDISTISSNSDTLQIFEGFMDMLSFASLYGNDAMQSFDTIVLNSVANIQKIKNILIAYKKVHLYLDNDEAGRSIVTQLLSDYDNIIDCSFQYKEHKDFNDFLISIRHSKRSGECPRQGYVSGIPKPCFPHPDGLNLGKYHEGKIE